MNYIFLDLEWNSAYSKRHKRFINEIVQLGADKLAEDFRELDRFSVTICSCLTKKLSRRFIELTGITNEQMWKGISFDEAVTRYNAWADAENCITMTYSDSDLYAISDNCQSFLENGKSIVIHKYANLQILVQDHLRRTGHEIVNQISLSSAAELHNIDISGYDMHTAFDDSLVSAELFRKSFNKEVLDANTVLVSDPEFFKRLTFKAYPISDIDSPFINTEKLRFYCEKCGSKAKRKSKWKYSNRWFSANFICSECSDRFVGRVSFKKTYDGVVSKRKILHPTPAGEKKNDLQPVSEKV